MQKTEATTNKYAKLNLGEIEAVFNKFGGIDGARRFLNGELVLVERPKPKPVTETLTEDDKQWWLDLLFGKK